MNTLQCHPIMMASHHSCTVSETARLQSKVPHGALVPTKIEPIVVEHNSSSTAAALNVQPGESTADRLPSK